MHFLIALSFSTLAIAQDTGAYDTGGSDTGGSDTGYYSQPCAYECEESGGCVEVDGECRPTEDEHCEESTGCYEYGDCALVGEECKPTEDEHCAESGDCSSFGYCGLVEGECAITSDDDCLGTYGCEESGDCAYIDGACAPGSDADCEASSGCGWAGDCGLLDGYCVPTEEMHCAVSEECIDYGYCALDEGECVATAAACEAAEPCERSGLCGESEGECVAVDDADCKASSDCRVIGDCHLVDESCQPLGPEDCETPCAVAGNCEFVTPPVVTNAEPSAEPPADNPGGILGMLAMDPGPLATLFSGVPTEPTCLPRSMEDCEQSQRCQEEESGCVYEDFMGARCSDGVGLVNMGGIGSLLSYSGAGGEEYGMGRLGGVGGGGGGDMDDLNGLGGLGYIDYGDSGDDEGAEGYGVIGGLGELSYSDEGDSPVVGVRRKRGDTASADFLAIEGARCDIGDSYTVKVRRRGVIIKGGEAGVVDCLYRTVGAGLSGTARGKYILTRLD